MTRFVMVADLRRCVGCQTCTATCKQANGTPPGVQWRRVVDLETGVYPDVQRVFVPTGCQHCARPACLEACPTTATYQRDNGMVQIDYELCIGCGYCAVACPYEARYKVEEREYAYAGQPMAHEQVRYDDKLIGVAQKCTFCVERVDDGLAQGLTPGVDPEATPACANACISGALTFGDLDDPDSPVSQLLATTRHFRLHEDAGTEPGFYYIWDQDKDDLEGLL